VVGFFGVVGLACDLSDRAGDTSYSPHFFPYVSRIRLKHGLRCAKEKMLPRPLLQKILHICELPHIGAAKKCASPYQQAQRDIEGMQMRARMVGIAIVVAIGLIWSVAAMSNLVPVDGSGVSLASISRPSE